ncbi:MAG: YdeI/OmpD-associated family protein [Chitinophagales bacterium]|nr:YdeI/OmpD-associated family protein [Chitinophagales bacterium]
MSIKVHEIEAYILRSKDFAKPILIHFRNLVHQACPEVEEKIKWSFPHFDYLGEMMCSMAAFKEHCSLGFWKYSLLNSAPSQHGDQDKDGMGSFGKIKSLKEMPLDKVLTSMVKEAMKLNKQGIKLPSRSRPAEKKELVVPDYFIAFLKKNKKAYQVFENFPYSHKKEYVQWIEEAKTEPTRIKRIETAMEWIAEGRGRNWKYESK